MIRSVLGIVVSVVIFVAASPVVGAEATPILSRIVETGKLRIGMTGDQPPLNALDKNGKMIGLEVDLANVMASAMGVELEIVRRPFAKLLPALKAGEVDLVMSGMTITLERNLDAAFVGPYFLSGKSILTNSNTLAQADESSDINIKDLKLAALEGSTSQKFVELVTPNAKLVTIQNYDEGVALVREDKVDAMVADMPACVLSVLRYPGSGLVTLVSPLTVEPIGMALPPNDPLFVNLVENYLGAVKSMGALEALNRKWLQDANWIQQLP